MTRTRVFQELNQFARRGAPLLLLVCLLTTRNRSLAAEPSLHGAGIGFDFNSSAATSVDTARSIALTSSSHGSVNTCIGGCESAIANTAAAPNWGKHRSTAVEFARVPGSLSSVNLIPGLTYGAYFGGFAPAPPPPPPVSPPAITSVSPNAGRLSGGEAVIITGSNFTGATSVTFGGASSPSFSIRPDGSIQAVTPAGSAGAASVIVTTPAGSNAANTLFTYVAPPTVTSVSPSCGLFSGGYSVTITGTGFTGATSVLFGYDGWGCWRCLCFHTWWRQRLQQSL